MDQSIAKKEKKILVVEDDHGINSLISYNLSKEGFEVVSVYDGLTAQNRISNEVFDIVLLDIMLPGIDGFHICKAIKDDSAAYKTFVIILSAKAEWQDKVYGNLVGADYYLTKPFSIVKLLEIINELLVMRNKEYSVSNRGILNKPLKEVRV
ncbi:MAG: response regulator [Candidatus Omnitrophica bacterium]|nr:response regulator [Candidatus Omnitrophota bacterium]